MKPMKITEREFSVPMLAGTIVPMMNEAMDLGFSFPMMILVAAVACIYSGLRIWNKNVEIKYGCACKSPKLTVGGGEIMMTSSAGAVTSPAAITPDKPAAPPPAQ